MQGRRELLTAIGAAAVAVGVAGMVGVTRRPSSGGAVSDALGLRPGARFHTCSVTDVRHAPGGGVAVHMADAGGRRFELEILAHDPRTPGVAQGGSLAVYVQNHGNGATTTVEEHGLAAMALARHLAQREAEGAGLPRLPTLASRSAQAPAPA